MLEPVITRDPGNLNNVKERRFCVTTYCDNSYNPLGARVFCFQFRLVDKCRLGFGANLIYRLDCKKDWPSLDRINVVFARL